MIKLADDKVELRTTNVFLSSPANTPGKRTSSAHSRDMGKTAPQPKFTPENPPPPPPEPEQQAGGASGGSGGAAANLIDDLIIMPETTAAPAAAAAASASKTAHRQ